MALRPQHRAVPRHWSADLSKPRRRRWGVADWASFVVMIVALGVAVYVGTIL